MTTRNYSAVGQTISGAQLSALSEAGVLVFDSAEALLASEAAALSSGEPLLPIGTIAALIAEEALVIRYYAADLAQVWRYLSPTATPELARRPGLLRTPPASLRWESPIGAITLEEAQAATATGNYPTATGRLFARESDYLIDSHHVYEVLTEESLTALADCEIALLAVGGGGSGAGMAFSAAVEIGGTAYPHTPIGGGGGGSGELIPIHVRLRRGDVLSIAPGAGGVPQDVTGSTFLALAESQAGGDTFIYLNGVELARAGGGSGGRNVARTALADQLNGRAIAVGFGLGSGGGGGIIPATSPEYLTSRTGNPPTAWEPLNELPPIAHRRRGGDGIRLSSNGPWERAADSSGLAQWNLYAGSGGGGISPSGDYRHGEAGLESVANSPPRTSPQPITYGTRINWTGTSRIIAHGGGGGSAVGSPALDFGIATTRGASPSVIGSGSGGGGVWQTTADSITGGAVSYSISYPVAAQAGGVYIRHARPGVRLARNPAYSTPPPAWLPRLLTNSAPLAPEITLTPPTNPNLAEPLEVRITPEDPDFGDPPTGWVLRRSINGAAYEYLTQNGRSSSGSDVWVATETAATIRPINPDLGYLTYDYELRPGWGTATQHADFEAKTIDQAGASSPWAVASVLPLTGLPPDQPTLSAVPPGTEFGTLSTPGSTKTRTETPITLSWVHSSPGNNPQVGFKLIRWRAGLETESSALIDEALGYNSESALAFLPGNPGDGGAILSGAGSALVSAITGDGLSSGSNWIASTDSSLTLPPTLWATETPPVIYGYGLATITQTTEGLAQSPLSNTFFYESEAGAVAFSGLPEGAQPPLAIGGAPRTHVFEINPADSVVTAASSPDLFAVSITGSGSSTRVLTITPPSLVASGNYSSEITITGTRSGYASATASITFTLTEPPPTLDPPLEIVGLLSSYEVFAGGETTDAFFSGVRPTPNTFSARSPTYTFLSADPGIAQVEVAAGEGVGVGADLDRDLLRINGISVGSTTFAISAAQTGFSTAYFSGAVEVLAAPAVPSAVGLEAAVQAQVGIVYYDYFDVLPADASPDSLFLFSLDDGLPDGSVIRTEPGPFPGRSEAWRLFYYLSAPIADYELTLSLSGAVGVSPVSIIVTATF